MEFLKWVSMFGTSFRLLNNALMIIDELGRQQNFKTSEASSGLGESSFKLGLDKKDN